MYFGRIVVKGQHDLPHGIHSCNFDDNNGSDTKMFGHDCKLSDDVRVQDL